MPSPIQASRTEAPSSLGKKTSRATASAAVAIALVLQSCGGGGGGGGRDAEVISEALVADGPSSCSVEVRVYTGPDVHDIEGICIVFVNFALFDPSGKDLEAVPPLLYTLRPRQTIDLHLQICSGQRGLSNPVLAAGPPSLFLIPDVDRCPSGTVIDVPVPNTYLVRPLQEVPCQTIGRVQTTLTPCG